MNQRGSLTTHMQAMVALFAPRCADRSTLDELREMLDEREKWRAAHALFDRVRRKSLAAEREKDEVAAAQYAFEEICAKTLYNLSGESAPFDADSPYWVIPRAIAFARMLGVADMEVLTCISSK